MLLKQIVQSKEGPVELTLNLSDEEFRFIVEVGVNILYAHGSIPFITADKEALVVLSTPEQVQ